MVRRYHLPYEVAQHNTPGDIWISFLGNVVDLTSLVREYSGALSEPLIRVAGTDVSHWFDEQTRDVKKHVDAVTNLVRYYTPMGLFPHIPPSEPMANWDTSFGIPWWKDKKFFIGKLSSQVRIIRIKNVLTNTENTVEVPCEETVAEIRERYLEINAHAHSYTFKAIISSIDGSSEFEELDLRKTLQENGVIDETATFEDHSIPSNEFVPVIHAYWNDE